MADGAERETTKLGVTSNFCTKKTPFNEEAHNLIISFYLQHTWPPQILHCEVPKVCGDAFPHPTPVLPAIRVPPSSPHFSKTAFPNKNHPRGEGPPLLPSKAHFLASPAADRSGPPALTAFSLIRDRG